MKAGPIVVKGSLCILLTFLMVCAISCAVNPVTKKRELMLLSESDEKALGKQTDQQVLQTYGVYNDPEVVPYLEALGQKLAHLSHRPELNYTFRLLDSPVVNAFAVPGGYVYLTRGILSYLNSEAELAGVMGHEIGHVAARHSAEQYSRAQLAQLGLGLGASLSEDFRKIAGLAQAGTTLLFLKFSRDDEQQADTLGVEYASKAGYDARRMADFFVTMEQMSAHEKQGSLPGWLSTHPNPADRVTAIRQLAQEWQQKLGKTDWDVDHDAYLRKIDGIVYGDDPRQGYVESGVFYHPELKIQFPVPDQWQLNNTPSEVQMVSPKQEAAILFSLASEASPLAASKTFADQTKATVISSEPTQVNGLSAHRVISDITIQQTPEKHIRVLSYFIQKGNQTYAFHGYADPTLFDSYSSAFSRTMEQFRPLNAPEKINVKPTRLRIKKVEASASLRSILQRSGVPQDQLEEIAIINGKGLDETVPANTLIKVIEN